jgi:hypothetical protein
MSNEIELNMKITPPIRRVTIDGLSSDSNEQIKKIKKGSYNLVKQSIKINNNQSSTILRERSTSSSSSSSINDSLKSFSPDLSLNQDDDVSSNDENLDQIPSNLTIRQLSKSTFFFSFN